MPTRAQLLGVIVLLILQPLSGASAEVEGVQEIWRMEILRAGEWVGPASRLVSSPNGDWNPDFSPDGRRIVFESLRGTSRQNWVANANGGDGYQLTFLPRALAGTPRWSPGGKQIAFDSSEGEIYTVAATGGTALNVSGNVARDVCPSWSHDGTWIYFGSNRTKRFEIWKVPAGGGTAVQVTANGGYVARESKDGGWLYYTKSPPESGLWRMPVEGGPEACMIESVMYRAFAATAHGVYYLTDRGADEVTLSYLDLSIGRKRILRKLAPPLRNGFSLSHDERFILFSKIERKRAQ